MNPSQPPSGDDLPDDRTTRPGGKQAGEQLDSTPRSVPPASDVSGGQRLWQILQDEGELDETGPTSRRAKQPEWAPPAPDADQPPVKLFKPHAGPLSDSGNVDLRDKELTSASQEGITRIQRILSDPELVEDEVDFRRQTQDGDFDTALRNYYRDSGAAIMCKNHPNRPVVDQCPACSAYFCQECIVVRRGRLLCRDCAESIFIRSEEEILSAHELGDSGGPTEILPEEKPEFQISSGTFGIDGRPAHPIKKLLALLLDLLLSRGIVLAISAVVGFIFNQHPGAFFHLFDSVEGEPILDRVVNAMLLLKPMMPWLIVFIVSDYLYFFITLSFFNRTFGMSWLSCRIVTEWGDFANFSTVALRVLVFMVCLDWPAILLSWFFPGYRGPHDYAAGTIVINYSGNKRIDAYDTVQIRLD